MKHHLLKATFVALAVFSSSFLYAKAENAGNDNYIFGCATCLGDSIIYISDIQSLQGITLNKKNGLAEMHHDYAHEFESALNDKYNKHFTCALFVSTKKKDVEKKYLGILKRMSKNKSIKIEHVGISEFQFKRIDISK